ncbi:MAG: virginiamycin B lyase family protein, partial [Ktedonobacteraceae bacterium]
MKHYFWPTLVLAFLLASLLAACGNTSLATTKTGTGTSGVPSTLPNHQPNTPALMARGHFQEFALPQNNSGLMRPVSDAQGRIWFGEMTSNYLGSFDPQTGKFWQQTPPHGQWGIMGIAAAPDETIWFAEQYANYIGHFFPHTGHYQIYQLPTITQPDPTNASKTLSLPSAPNDLILDTHGILWFTELNANTIGSLNTANGSLRYYALTSDPKAQSLNPYGIAVDPQGTVWFSEASTNRLGQLNPATGQINYFTPPSVTSPLMELASDAHGQIWATTFDTGQLLRFNPAQSSFTTYNAPTLN